MNNPNKLSILWTNDNPITSEKMVFMYSLASKQKGWWQDITIILWGATVKLASENECIQELIKEALDNGIHVSACLSCADQLGVTDKINALHIETIYWGEPLTEIIKTDGKLITI